MIEKEDFTKYLSYDNGKGLLLKQNDVFILNSYGIELQNYDSLSELIFDVGSYIDNYYDDEIEELEEVLSNLIEIYYYEQIKK